MKHFRYIFIWIIPIQVFAQLTIVSTNPQNNATNVPLNTVVAITFSSAVDTVQFDMKRTGFSNVPTVGDDYFSADAKTLYATASLSANHAYFFGLLGVKGKDGSTLQSPFVSYFTTGASFPALSVSGTVASGRSGVSPQNSIVGLSTAPLADGEPNFAAWANVNSDGTFSIPYVENGVYWPIAAKDVNGDGSIDPDKGVDVLAKGDSIIVNNASLSNVTLTFMSFTPYTMAEALPIADSLARSLPADRSLRSIRSYSVEVDGRASDWSFYYAINNNTAAMRVRVRTSGSRVEPADTGNLFSILSSRPLENPQLAASSSLVISNVESAGGQAFRQQAHPDSLVFEASMTLGDLGISEYQELSPESNQYYWGVMYSFGVDRSSQWNTYRNKSWLCNMSSGTVLKTTAVTDAAAALPLSAGLMQNFPNPFNPSTTIEYQIPERAFVSLKIIDMLGREAAVLVNEDQSAGRKTVRWNAGGMASGMYFYRLTAGRYIDQKKMMFVK